MAGKSLVVILALVLIGCGGSEQTTTETHVLLPVTIDTVQTLPGSLFIPSPCDTAGILERYCRGYAEGYQDGISYAVEWYTRVDTVIQKDTTIVVRTVPILRTNIVRDTIKIMDVDTVRVTMVEEFGFWDKVGFALQVIGVVVVIGVVLFFALRFGLKLPI